MVHWNWQLTRNGAVRLGLMLLSFSFVYQNLSWLNFLTQFQVGSILLSVFGIFIIRHIYRTLKWYYIWVKHKKKLKNLIIHFCLYLIVFSITLSAPLHLNTVNSGFEKLTPRASGASQQEPLQKPNMYVVCDSMNSVYAIDTDKDTIVATINVGNNPWGIVVSHDGKKAYVVNSGDDSVSVIDTITNTVESTIYVEKYHGMNPRDIVISPDGAKLYICDSSSISVVDVNTKKIVATIGNSVLVDGALCPAMFSPTSLTISPDGTKLYVLDSGGSVIVIDTNKNAITATISNIISFPDIPSGISITPDGNKLYVTTGLSTKIINTITIIDTNTNNVIDSIDIGSKKVGRVVFNSDGTRAYINGDNTSVRVLDTANNAVISTVRADDMTFGENGIRDIGLTYDGTKLYVISDMLRVIDTSTNKIVYSTTKSGTGAVAIFIPLNSGCNMATMPNETKVHSIPMLQYPFVILSLIVLYVFKRST